jgi:hypothetical protein
MLYFCEECRFVFYGDLRECPNCHKVNLTPLSIIQNYAPAQQSVQPTGCPDCGSPYAGGKLEAHFTGCPREKRATSG